MHAHTSLTYYTVLHGLANHLDSGYIDPCSSQPNLYLVVLASIVGLCMPSIFSYFLWQIIIYLKIKKHFADMKNNSK